MLLLYLLLVSNTSSHSSQNNGQIDHTILFRETSHVQACLELSRLLYEEQLRKSMKNPSYEVASAWFNLRVQTEYFDLTMFVLQRYLDTPGTNQDIELGDLFLHDCELYLDTIEVFVVEIGRTMPLSLSFLFDIHRIVFQWHKPELSRPENRAILLKNIQMLILTMRKFLPVYVFYNELEISIVKICALLMFYRAVEENFSFLENTVSGSAASGYDNMDDIENDGALRCGNTEFKTWQESLDPTADFKFCIGKIKAILEDLLLNQNNLRLTMPNISEYFKYEEILEVIDEYLELATARGQKGITRFIDFIEHFPIQFVLNDVEILKRHFHANYFNKLIYKKEWGMVLNAWFDLEIFDH